MQAQQYRRVSKGAAQDVGDIRRTGTGAGRQGRATRPGVCVGWEADMSCAGALQNENERVESGGQARLAPGWGRRGRAQVVGLEGLQLS
jgi:hypothetical protein